jgi:hypothetical protein
MKTVLRVLLLVIFVTVLSACSPSEADQRATVEALVAETVAAIPTQSPQATLLPLPTYTPEATFTAVPSQTPLPTYTPYPTYTPPATATESPTATATAEPATAPTTSGQSAPTSTPVALANVGEQLAAKIQDELTRIDIFRSSLRPRKLDWGNNYTDLPTDCGAVVSSYDSIANVLTVDVSAQSPNVQNAYGIYRAATDTVLSLMVPWADICRADLASGVSRRIIDYNQHSILYPALDQPIGQLNQAINSLQSP